MLLQAGRLKRELRRLLPGSTVKTALGSVGQMDVFANGKLLFSYQAAGHLPSAQEILKLLPST
ncbi:MAG TPA: Rdx family protein [Terriglobales bacterium]|nr:Rdx family protein [Terriglobales bacterium]